LKVFLASDHGGFSLKERIRDHLKEAGVEVEDLGTNNEDSVDYPEYANKVAEGLLKSNSENLGILVCGTGIGMSIAANKVKGIYAAQVNSEEEAKLSKEHNNANVICLGGRVLEEQEAMKIVDTFLNTPFSNEERHIKRIDKIRELEG